jgi:hypothetical protein
MSDKGGMGCRGDFGPRIPRISTNFWNREATGRAKNIFFSFIWLHLASFTFIGMARRAPRAEVFLTREMAVRMTGIDQLSLPFIYHFAFIIYHSRGWAHHNMPLKTHV